CDTELSIRNGSTLCRNVNESVVKLAARFRLLPAPTSSSKRAKPVSMRAPIAWRGRTRASGRRLVVDCAIERCGVDHTSSAAHNALDRIRWRNGNRMMPRAMSAVGAARERGYHSTDRHQRYTDPRDTAPTTAHSMADHRQSLVVAAVYSPG